MSEISPNIAVDHILNSLENTNADFWTNPDTDETWQVSGYVDEIRITVYDDDDEETSTTRYRLVKIDED